MVASVLSVISMMIAIRRRDDGPLTSIFSFIGWSCIFSSRILIFSVLSSRIHGWIILVFGVHSIGFAVWIYMISVESYESVTPSSNQVLEPSPSKPLLITNIMIFFAIPSLFYWPIMFNFKEFKRPFKFLIVMILENICLILMYIICVKSSVTKDLWMIITAVIIFSLIGSIMILLYTWFKPGLTDQVVLYDTKIDNKDSYGIYFEFCQLVLKLPLLTSVSSNIKIIRGLHDDQDDKDDKDD